MAWKNEAQPTSRWQKLSGFIGRHGSTKTKKAPEVPTEKGASAFKLRRQKQDEFSQSTLDFKPLEVDLKDLEKLRIAEGWLESPRRPEPEQQLTPPPPPPQPPSTTPIADLFASKPPVKPPVKTQEPEAPARASLDSAANGVRPQSMFELQNFKQIHAPADRVSIYSTQTTTSILDRGRPLESRRVTTDPTPSITATVSEAIPPATVAHVSNTSTARDRPMGQPRSMGGSSSVPPRQSAASKLRIPEESNNINRHSMYAQVPSAQNRTAAVSAVPRDRIQSWQKNVNQTPSSQAALPVRRVSTRSAGDRLAWIKELEEKKSKGVNRDLDVLKKQQGSVLNKLAMFERHEQVSQRFSPLTRTNSTASRLSSVGLESGSSANGNVPASSRTSIDTARSHRTSSVMDNYDDSFREKMEGIANSQPDPDEPKRQRVTTQFVSVEPSKDKKKRRSGTPRTSTDPKSPRNSVDMKSPRSSVDTKRASVEKGEMEVLPAISPEVEVVKPEQQTQENQPSQPLQTNQEDPKPNDRAETQTTEPDSIPQPQSVDSIEEEKKSEPQETHSSGETEPTNSGASKEADLPEHPASLVGDEPVQTEKDLESPQPDNSTPAAESEPEKPEETPKALSPDQTTPTSGAEPVTTEAAKVESQLQTDMEVPLEESKIEKPATQSETPGKEVASVEA